MVDFDDAFQKFERGKTLLSDYLTSMQKALREGTLDMELKKQPYKKPEADPRPHWQAYDLYVTRAPIIPKQDGILLGETIQSFRNSLDYLAWALVTKYSKRRLTESEKRRIEFPMAHSHENFQNRVTTWLPDVPPSICNFLERYQPYRRSSNGITMRYLKILSNTDKHRIIMPALLAPEMTEGNISCEGGEFVKWLFHLKQGQDLKAGTKVLTTIIASNDPNPRVHLDQKLSLIPMFPRKIVRPYFPDTVVLIEPTLYHIRDRCFEILSVAKKFF